MKNYLVLGLILLTCAACLQKKASDQCVGNDCFELTDSANVASRVPNSTQVIASEVAAGGQLTTEEAKLIEELHVGKHYDFDIANDPTTGDSNANVIVVVYEDFLCGHCATWAGLLSTVLKRVKQGVKLVVRPYPLDMNCKGETREFGPHRGASLAAMASRAAQLQNKFWGMRELLFAKQDSYVDEESGPEFTRENIDEIALEANLDLVKYKTFMDSKASKKWLKSKIAQACGIVDDEKKRVVTGTPTLFVNGIELDFDKLGQKENRFQNFIQAMVKKYPPTLAKKTN